MCKYVLKTLTNVSKRPSILCIYREINLVIKKQDAEDVWLSDKLPQMSIKNLANAGFIYNTTTKNYDFVTFQKTKKICTKIVTLF